MSAAAVLAEARRLGIRLTARGDRLAYDAPRDAFTPEMRDALVTHKPEILALLRAEQQQADSSPKPLTLSDPTSEPGAVSTRSDKLADQQAALDSDSAASTAWPSATTHARSAGVPWQCTSRFCFHKERWWVSVHRVVNCLNHCPPSFPCLVLAQGTLADAPLVGPDRSNEVIGPLDLHRCISNFKERNEIPDGPAG
jgi:TubC N-terminal docking domain